MNKRERVLAALDGRKTDRIPFTLWRHFYHQAQTAQGLAASTLAFYRQCTPDMIVLAPGPFYMAEAWGLDIRSFSSDSMSPYLAGPAIRQATDWRKLPELDISNTTLTREIEAVRQIKAQLDEEDAPIVVPLFSPLTTANILCDNRIIQDMRSFSNDLCSALGVIATITEQFAKACLDAGADGFVFVTQLAGKGQMRAREYRDFGQQFDLQVLKALEYVPIRILHLDSERPIFELADRYPVQAVCWATWHSDPSLANARRQTRRTLMGGLNPTTFASGSKMDVQEQIKDAIAQTEGWQILISPSGPLPPDSREELLSAVHEILEKS